MLSNYEKPEHHRFSDFGWSEDAVQRHIADDPSVLGLGDLELRIRERRQPSGGRFDLLLQSPGLEETIRYVVEVQNAPTDPSHIIRTIEYWDVERKRYPQNTYRAVIVASEITSRYFNVISLFNQYIPIIAIKMTPISVGDKKTLIFTKILDYSPLGTEEEDTREVQSSRAEMEKSIPKETMESVDSVVAAAKAVSPEIQAKYNKGYIQLKIGSSFFKLLSLFPKKSSLQMELPSEQSEETEAKLGAAKIEYLGYDEQRHRYVLLLRPQDAARNSALLTELISSVYQRKIANDA